MEIDHNYRRAALHDCLFEGRRRVADGGRRRDRLGVLRRMIGQILDFYKAEQRAALERDREREREREQRAGRAPRL